MQKNNKTKFINNTTLLSKTILYFIGNFSSKILSFLIMPIYAYYVSADNLGSFDYMQTISGMITPILFLSIWEAVLKYVINEDDELQKERKTATIIMFAMGGTILAALLGCIVLTHFSFEQIDNSILVGLVIVQGLTLIWQFFARAYHLNKLYVVSSVWGTVTYLILSIIMLVVLDFQIKGLFLSFLISQCLIIFIIEAKLKLIKKIKIKLFDLSFLKKALLFSSPLIVNQLSLWVFDGANKVMIINKLGSSFNGIYAFANRFSYIITMVSSVLSMSLIEEAYSYNSLEEYKKTFSKLLEKISRGYFAVIILCLPMIKILYNLMFLKSEYYESSNYVFLLLLSALFLALANNYGSSFQVTDKTQYVFLTTGFGAIITIIISFLLIDKLGIYGALIGKLVGTISMMVTRAIYAKKFTGMGFSWWNNIVNLIIIIFEGIVLINLSFVGTFIVFVIALVWVVINNKNHIKKIIQQIQTKKRCWK